MDEMERAFNLTTSALKDTIRVADERDIKQNERIVALEKRLSTVQESFDVFETFLNDLKLQVFKFDYKLFFDFLKLFVFIVFQD